MSIKTKKATNYGSNNYTTIVFESILIHKWRYTMMKYLKLTTSLFLLSFCLISCGVNEAPESTYTGDGENINRYVGSLDGISNNSYYYAGSESTNIAEGEPQIDGTRTMVMKEYLDGVDKLAFIMPSGGYNENGEVIHDVKFTPNEDYFTNTTPLEASAGETLEILISEELPKGAVIGRVELWYTSGDGFGGMESFYDYFDVLNQ